MCFQGQTIFVLSHKKLSLCGNCYYCTRQELDRMAEWSENATMLPAPPACPGQPSPAELLWEEEVSARVATWLDAVVGTAIGITGTIGKIRSDDNKRCSVCA